MSLPHSSLFILCSFSLSVFLNFSFRTVAKKIGLIAYSGNHRQHISPTPLIGGVSMYLAIIITMAVLLLLGKLSFQELLELRHYLLAITLLVVVGALDDRHNLSFIWRFLIQIVAVFIMIHHGNVLLDLGELFSEKTLFLGRFSSFMTIFATVGVINAINMSDGIDGLAGSFSLLLLFILAFFVFDKAYHMMIVIWMGALLGFLMFNFPLRGSATVFMGDAGSTALGFTLAWLFIAGSQHSMNAESSLFHPIFAVWLLALPLFDTVSVMLIRLLKGNSPFRADRFHMHHHVLNRLGSTKMSVFVMLLWFLAYALLGICLHKLNIEQSKQTMLFSIFFILHLLLQFKLSKQKKHEK